MTHCWPRHCRSWLKACRCSAWPPSPLLCCRGERHGAAPTARMWPAGCMAPEALVAREGSHHKAGLPPAFLWRQLDRPEWCKKCSAAEQRARTAGASARLHACARLKKWYGIRVWSFTHAVPVANRSAAEPLLYSTHAWPPPCAASWVHPQAATARDPYMREWISTRVHAPAGAYPPSAPCTRHT